VLFSLFIKPFAYFLKNSLHIVFELDQDEEKSSNNFSDNKSKIE
jgi:hypothetical protein